MQSLELDCFFVWLGETVSVTANLAEIHIAEIANLDTVPDKVTEHIAVFLNTFEVSCLSFVSKPLKQNFELELQFRWEVFVDSKKHLISSHCR